MTSDIKNNEIIWCSEIDLFSLHQDVLYFFDEPLLFVVCFQNEQYLFIKVDEDQNNDSIYLVSSTTDEKIKDLRSNNLTVYDAVYSGLVYIGMNQPSYRFVLYPINIEHPKILTYMPKKGVYLNG